MVNFELLGQLLIQVELVNVLITNSCDLAKK